MGCFITMKKVRKDIKVKVKENRNWDNFIKFMGNYAKDKYGALVTSSENDVYVRDMVSIVSYSKSSMNEIYEKYRKNEIENCKQEIDTLLYMQVVHLFLSMFPSYSEEDTEDNKFLS